ncbi:hypothetical protein A3A46_03730 [Candidatus Roizmanbacteria bacterium RIFCSPLOWO2_01_FULL_37_13]|uniref:ATP-cone domain-containing protein n=1 Tax=Candidatus Roizmanbacteria bacterium RIFCSPHIGHO2_02_FULL_38_11 TaxID=1802039 RepID=A0A1F7H332_9BACT|nr:MAG: hypothetical protein A3C25_00510 [Candidatus Roizmanbacteria bacterium RIFCSPHIGHO2_02_FULL_38_11]OGK41033.1 MAG: hypothetical protein A3A46_03730 [Candidatus Roizmanbacteria bacterium RIFCSPLOWO2_01_FULL_37_13]
MNLQVIKRDGSIEDYNEAKITRVVIAAGLNPDQAQTLASAIAKWIKKNTLTKLSSLKLRDKVLEELKKANKDAANLFSWYEKTKE